MRNRFVGVALVAALAACTPTQPTPQPNIYVSVPTTINVGNGTPASPGSGGSGGALPDGSSVIIGAFGLQCPSGTPIPSANRTIPVACTMAVTCSPKDRNGVLLPPAVTGSSPTFFGVSQGAQYVRAAPWEDEPFNLNVLGVAPGSFSLDCTDKDVRAARWDGLVVPPGGAASAGEPVRWQLVVEPQVQSLHDLYRILRRGERFQ
jgi:hypothetical protein